jgi:hypothetical protein
MNRIQVTQPTFLINTLAAITVYVMLAVVFFSCSNHVSDCNNPTNGKAVLVAYRVAKHSHLWFQNPKTKKVYDIGGVGGRREPNINLGDAINVQYCNGEIMLDRYRYVKQANNLKTRFIHLDGFGGLY